MENNQATSVVVGAAQPFSHVASEERDLEKDSNQRSEFRFSRFSPSTKEFIAASNKEQIEASDKLTLQVVSNKYMSLAVVGLLTVFSAVIIGLVAAITMSLKDTTTNNYNTLTTYSTSSSSSNTPVITSLGYRAVSLSAFSSLDDVAKVTNVFFSVGIDEFNRTAFSLIPTSYAIAPCQGTNQSSMFSCDDYLPLLFLSTPEGTLLYKGEDLFVGKPSGILEQALQYYEVPAFEVQLPPLFSGLLYQISADPSYAWEELKQPTAAGVKALASSVTRAPSKPTLIVAVGGW